MKLTIWDQICIRGGSKALNLIRTYMTASSPMVPGSSSPWNLTLYDHYIHHLHLEYIDFLVVGVLHIGKDFEGGLPKNEELGYPYSSVGVQHFLKAQHKGPPFANCRHERDS